MSSLNWEAEKTLRERKKNQKLLALHVLHNFQWFIRTFIQVLSMSSSCSYGADTLLPIIITVNSDDFGIIFKSLVWQIKFSSYCKSILICPNT